MSLFPFHLETNSTNATALKAQQTNSGDIAFLQRNLHAVWTLLGEDGDLEVGRMLKTAAQRSSVNILAGLLHPGDYKERKNQLFSPLSLTPFSRVKIRLPYAEDQFLEASRILVSVTQACGCFRHRCEHTGVTHNDAIILFPFGEGSQGSSGVSCWGLFLFLNKNPCTESL